MKNKSYAIFGIIFLLLSLVGGMYLVGQNADNRNKAVSAGSCNCVNEHGTNAGSGTCNGTSCICGAGKRVKQNRCGEDSGGGGGRPICPNNQCTKGQSPICQGGPNNNTGYKCTCVNAPFNGQSGANCEPWAWQCSTPDLKMCPKNDVGVDPNAGKCSDPAYNASISGRCIVGKNGASITAHKYTCPDIYSSPGGCQDNGTVVTGNKVCFDSNFCGVQQIDVSYPGCWISVVDVCATPTRPRSPTNTPRPTATPTRRINSPTPTRRPPTATPTTRINSPTPTRRPPTATPTSRPGSPTPTYRIITDTPPVNSPTPTPTTPIDQPTNTPIPTNTPAIYACGYTPCDDNGRQCSSGLVCVTANNNNQYCSRPEYSETCKMNPGYAGCCTHPVAEGPSPTRIILPVSGFEFPAQALTIVGGIATLLGFLVLL